MIWWIYYLISSAKILKKISLDGNFFVFDISFISPKDACFFCAICGNVTAFFSFAQNYTVQNNLWNKQVCPKFINVIIENNPLYKSDAKSTLYNVAIKASPLLSHIFMCTCPFSFAVM